MTRGTGDHWKLYNNAGGGQGVAGQSGGKAGTITTPIISFHLPPVFPPSPLPPPPPRRSLGLCTQALPPSSPPPQVVTGHKPVDVLRYLSVNAANPLTIITQDMARAFLSGGGSPPPHHEHL